MELVHIARADPDQPLTEAMRLYVQAARRVVEAGTLAQQYKASLAVVVAERIAAGADPVTLRRQLLDGLPNPDTAQALMRAAGRHGASGERKRNSNQLEIFAS
jgi:nucleotide-binding universal stress UspA family protein